MCFDWSGEYIQHLKIDLKTSGIKFIWHFVIPVFPPCFKQLQISRQYLNSRSVCLKKKTTQNFLASVEKPEEPGKNFYVPKGQPRLWGPARALLGNANSASLAIQCPHQGSGIIITSYQSSRLAWSSVYKDSLWRGSPEGIMEMSRR